MNKTNIDFLLYKNLNLIKKFKKDPVAAYNKILIVGYTGLIGINILASLLNLKKKFQTKSNIICLNNSDISHDLKKFLINNNIKYYKKDITKNFKLNNKFDLIIFCAGYSAPFKFMRQNENTILTQSIGLKNVSTYLNKGGKLVYFSSSEIYNGLKKNFNENFSGNINYNNPRAPYIVGKKFGEAYCNLIAKKGYSVLILRLCLAYGPGVNIDDKRVLNELVFNSLKSKKIRLLDDGSAVRNYIYINDVLYYLFKLINKSKYNLYNLTGNSITTILNLAKKISKINNSKLIISKKKNGIPGAVKYVNISSKRLNKEYKNNNINLNDGIKNVISWYKLLFKN